MRSQARIPSHPQAQQCRLSCLPFVWHFFSLWHTHTHTHTRARTSKGHLLHVSCALCMPYMYTTHSKQLHFQVAVCCMMQSSRDDHVRAGWHARSVTVHCCVKRPRSQYGRDEWYQAKKLIRHAKTSWNAVHSVRSSHIARMVDLSICVLHCVLAVENDADYASCIPFVHITSSPYKLRLLRSSWFSSPLVKTQGVVWPSSIFSTSLV